jgi:glycosyltransferase involved in cell wall biosynthesis
MARELGIGDRVHFPGIVADVRAWLACCDVFVTPSSREGLPTVLLEAMAMGRPVVASRVGGIPEIVIDGESGLLVPASAPEILAQAIDSLLRDPARGMRMGQAGQARVVAQFGLAEMLRKTESEYKRLLAVRKEAG